MCQSIPCEVVEVEGQWAVVKGLNHTHRVYLGLLKDVNIGDYLLVHGEMAINKIEKDEAETVLRLTCA